MAFVDFSTNNFQLTAFGNAQISTSVKKYGTASGYFDGNGDYLELTDNDAFELQGNDFTIECWFRVTTLKGYQAIANKSYNTTDQHGWLLYFEANNQFNFLVGNGSWSVILQSFIVPSINTWYHVAVTRSGSTWRLFIDGDLKATTTNSIVMNTGSLPMYIGRYPHFPGANLNQTFEGYIDDFRITKGIARYTSNFTPPQQQLPTTADPYFSNVSLLLPMNLGPFTDSSTNNLELTAAGNADLSTVVKKYGDGSGYFDGNGDYLETIFNNTFDFGTNNFTIEAWIYFLGIDSGSYQTIVGKWASPGLYSYILQIKSDTFSFAIGNNGNFVGIFSASTTFLTNTWYHLAISRSGGSMRFFVNGQQVGTTFSDSSNINTSANLQIGRNEDGNQQYFNGYIDDLRITKGIARYTSNFTPPQQQLPAPSDPYQDNVSLLLHMDNNQFTDSSSNNFTLSAFGDAQISTSVKKFGSGAGHFDGNGDYLSLPGSNAFNFYNTDYTIEMWVYSAASQTGGGLVSTRLGGAYSPWELQINSNNKIGLLIQSGGGSWYVPFGVAPIVGNITIPQNQWTHIAWVCNSSNTTVYVNGSADSGLSGMNIPILQAFAQPSNVYIGKGGDDDFNGYIDELRITKGVARYTSNFVPHTAPFVNPPPIPSGYLAFWKLADLTDSSGNGNNLVNTNNVQFVSGKIGNCAVFNASNFLSSSQGVPAGDFTLSYWLKLNAFTSAQVVGQLTFGCAFFGSGSTIFFANNASAQVQIGGPLNLGQWNHVVVRRSGSTFTIWTNGVLRQTQTNNVVSSSSQMQFGTGTICQIDAFGIWGRALTNDEIGLLYNNGNGIEL